MRFSQVVGAVALLLSVAVSGSAQAQGTEPRLAGFSYFHLLPPEYEDGRADPMNLVSYLGKQLAALGLKAVPAPTKLTDRMIHSATLVCAFGHTADSTPGAYNSAKLECLDPIGRVAFAFSGSGRAMTVKGV